METTASARFPLLEEVFREFPEVPMNIEIKTPHEEINKAVNELIMKYKREDRTVWGTRCRGKGMGSIVRR